MRDAADAGAGVPPVDRLLSSACCEPAELRGMQAGALTPIHRQVLSHWHARRGERRAPRHRDIDPGAIRQALPHVMIWQTGGDGEYVCRLSGTLVEDHLGGPLKGVRLGAIPCRLIDGVRREFDTVREHALACVAERTIGWAGKPFLFYRHLLLPLTHESDAVERMLSVLTFHSVGEAVARAS